MGRKLIGMPKAEGLAVTTPREPDDSGQREESTPGEADQRAADGREAAGPTITQVQDSADWVDRIKDAIPIEVVTAWIAIDAILLTGDEAAGATYLAAFAVTLVATALHMWVDIELPDADQSSWAALSTWKRRFAVAAHVGLAVGAFVVWALFLLTPATVHFGAVPFAPDVSFAPNEQFTAVLLVLYTLVGPQLVPDLVSKLLGVDVETVEESADGTST